MLHRTMVDPAFHIRAFMNWSSWGFGMPTNAADFVPAACTKSLIH